MSFPFLSGRFRLSWTHQKITLIQWIRESQFQDGPKLKEVPPESLSQVFHALRLYLETGAPIEFKAETYFAWIDAACDLSQVSDFQRSVFRAICDIPFGETRTYGWVASRLGRPAASRAVGQALKSNPLPLLIPCHRVVSLMSVGGFMGTDEVGDPEVSLKKKLIQLEEEYLNPVLPFISQPFGQMDLLSGLTRSHEQGAAILSLTP